VSRAAWIERALRATLHVTGTVAPPLGGRLAVRVFGTPVPRPPSSGARAFLARAERRDVRWRGGTVATYAVGGGPAGLLVHGWSSHGASLRAFAGALADAGFRAVAMDLPAHGGSTGNWSTIVLCAEAIGAVAAEIGPLHGAVCHSFGGSALLLAVARGHLPRPPRLVTLGVPVDVDRIVRSFCRRMGVPAGAARRMRARMDAIFGAPFTEFRAQDVAAEFGDGLLVVHDAGDRDVPVAESAVLAGEAGLRLVTEGLGHNRVLRDQGVVTRCVGFFGPSSYSTPKGYPAASQASIPPSRFTRSV